MRQNCSIKIWLVSGFADPEEGVRGRSVVRELLDDDGLLVDGIDVAFGVVLVSFQMADLDSFYQPFLKQSLQKARPSLFKYKNVCVSMVIWLFGIVAMKFDCGFDTKTPLLSSAQANEARSRMIADENIFLKKIYKCFLSAKM